MRVFKTKWFVRYARRERIKDESLCDAIQRAERGSVDRSVFLYGFAKNERENIDHDELATLREIAAGWLEADEERLKHAMEEGVLLEVHYDEKRQ